MYFVILGSIWFSYVRGGQIKSIGTDGFSSALRGGGWNGYVVSQAKTLVYLSDDGAAQVPERL